MSTDVATKTSVISSVTAAGAGGAVQLGFLDYAGLIIALISCIVGIAAFCWRVYNDLKLKADKDKKIAELEKMLRER